MLQAKNGPTPGKSPLNWGAGCRQYGVQVLRGQAQVVFLSSVPAGALLAVALFAAGWEYGLYAIAGAALGTATSRLLGADRERVSTGLEGFNACLTALCFAVFLGADHLSTALLAAAGCVVVTVVTAAVVNLLGVWNLPSLTLPLLPPRERDDHRGAGVRADLAPRRRPRGPHERGDRADVARLLRSVARVLHGLRRDLLHAAVVRRRARRSPRCSSRAAGRRRGVRGQPRRDLLRVGARRSRRAGSRTGPWATTRSSWRWPCAGCSWRRGRALWRTPRWARSPRRPRRRPWRRCSRRRAGTRSPGRSS